ncbi:unnamed protein product [Dracunculus medinensis]|uniref:Uncharacterized protein n=1 Tax=Dracunculus medinensis TaxID=318479 RepID=A0A0N4UCK5_DRAME|nr:unnamed protein product [Dracunculus medinensis]
MLQEQHGFEPVFISKKRKSRLNKLSELRGSDLNKFTSCSYAVKNGNEFFGGKCFSKFRQNE